MRLAVAVSLSISSFVASSDLGITIALQPLSLTGSSGESKSDFG